MSVLATLLCAAAGYLLGSFSTGLTLAKGAGVDLRSVGSKSTGATNVSRALGLRSGVLTFAGDFLKGAAAVLIGMWLFGRNGGIVSGVFAVIGHNWPLYYGFQGGKGVSTSCAVLLLLFPVPAAVGMALTLLIIILLRYVSVGSLTLLSVAAIGALASRPLFPDAYAAVFLAALGFYRHRANLERLACGKENKIDFRR